MADLASCTWPELDQAAPILFVPIGSTEQHGPHLPLGTDTLIATELARAIAESRSDSVVAPAVAIGASGEHRGFPGTLSIGTEVLVEVLVEVVRSSRDWVRGIVFVSGHGGNVEAIGRALARSESEGDAVVVVTASTPDGDLHAGRSETSLLLYLAASLVRETEAVAGASGTLDEMMGVLSTRGVAALSPNGVLGDPSGASSAEGHERFSAMCARACQAVEARFGP